MDRRTFLALGGSAVVAGCLFGDDDPPSGANGEQERPSDGGDGSLRPEDANGEGAVTQREQAVPITSLSGLSEMLAASVPGDYVSVPPEVEISLEGRWELTVPSGVTLDGGREMGTAGALLYSPDGDKTPEDNVFLRKIRLESGSRLTGFRLEGHFHEYVNPEEEHDGNYYAHRGGGGVEVKQGGEVDNNEISGWPYAAVMARGNAHIHNNYIHHNAWEGFGYGVAIPEGNHMPVIEKNRFNYNRHSITGAGGPNVGFIARFNVVEEEWVGSQFDMHGTEGMDGVAGEEIIIQRNTFRGTHTVEEKTRDPGSIYPAIDIRGTPTKGVYVEHNWFYHENREDAYRQPDGPHRAHFVNNHYGQDEPSTPTVGAPQTVSIRGSDLPLSPVQWILQSNQTE